MIKVYCAIIMRYIYIYVCVLCGRIIFAQWCADVEFRLCVECVGGGGLLKLFSLSLSVSVCLSVSLSVSLSLCVSVSLSLILSLILSLSHSISFSRSLSHSLSVSFSLSRSVCLRLSVSLSLSVCLSLHTRFSER